MKQLRCHQYVTSRTRYRETVFTLNHHHHHHHQFDVRDSMLSTGWTVPPKMWQFVERMVDVLPDANLTYSWTNEGSWFSRIISQQLKFDQYWIKWLCITTWCDCDKDLINIWSDIISACTFNFIHRWSACAAAHLIKNVHCLLPVHILYQVIIILFY